MAKRDRFAGNHRETAQLLGISEQALWKAVKERGCPVLGKHGKETLYDWREVLAWRVADLMPDDLDPARERARKDKEHADKLAMENAQRRLELVPTATVVHEVGEYIDSCRKRLTSLPGALAQHFDPETGRRIEAIARERVHEAVAELRDYRPWLDGRARGAVAPAAVAGGQPVGGSLSAPAGRKRGRARPVADG